MTNATEGENVIFGWVVFESREARDEVNEKVASDPRMGELMDPENPILIVCVWGMQVSKP